MIVSTLMVLGGGLVLGVGRRLPPDISATGEALREAYDDTMAEPVPRDMTRALRRISPTLKLVGQEKKR